VHVFDLNRSRSKVFACSFSLTSSLSRVFSQTSATTEETKSANVTERGLISSRTDVTLLGLRPGLG
jgi:hypothetical protein